MLVLSTVCGDVQPSFSSSFSLVAVGVASLIIAALFGSLVRQKKDRQKGWRVGHAGRDTMFYEEFRDGTWQRIHIDGEMLLGRAHHVIYFQSLEMPAWAHDRRLEIIRRIKSEFRPPDYEYDRG